MPRTPQDPAKRAPRIVILGSMGAAVSCAERLLDRSDLSLVGVVCSRDAPSPWRRAAGDRNMIDEVERLGLQPVELEDLPALQADLGLSIRFHQILRRRHLDAFALGVVNLHGAPLPEMRGSMCDSAALLEGRSEFGASLHWMDEGVDSGDLLAVQRFPIAATDTVQDLFRRSNEAGLDLLDRNLGAILSGALVARPQSEVARERNVEIRTYRKADVLAARALPAGASEERLWAAARAFSFPGHDPAWIETCYGRVRVWVEATASDGG